MGPHTDTSNMADIGHYLDEMPVNCALFVLSSAMPRIDHTLKRLINIVIHKVDRSDYNKLGVIVNHYKHTTAAKSERSELADGRSQLQQQAVRDEIAKSLEGSVSDQHMHPFLLNASVWDSLFF